MQQNDIERGLRIWGPIRAPISKKSLELWGSVEPEIIITVYRTLYGNSAVQDTLL
ncbi:hypothetical protein SAMN00808754_1455 [Thermanaeromonas toyohensis ToBE]|uniref:Uncharacterized protein n=1 Tax=Thermanaeromonas toyohensis ToBE TaxID=698762 RepID=A0A1W1VSX4_9FIRM|nr:hypothetical protein SAMN00808754_1455 [Thermanaeromonas toyohensis ToBE]